MKKIIALIVISTLLLSGCSLFGAGEESGSLSDKLSGLERDEQRETSTPEPEDTDTATAPVNTVEGINGSFDQMELVMELLSNTVTPENREGNGEFGLTPDMEEVERHRRMNPENEAMPDDYIYTTTWTGAEQGFGADWKISVYFRDAYTAYECRYSLDGMEYWDAVNAVDGALTFSFRNYNRYEGEPYSIDSYWVEGIGPVDDASEFQSIYWEKLEGDEDFVCVYSLSNPRRYNPSTTYQMGIDSDSIDEISVNLWRFEGETFLDFTYTNHFDTPPVSEPQAEPSESESTAATEKPPALYTEPDGSPTAMDMVRLGTYADYDVFGVGLTWSVTFYNDYTFEFSYDHEEGTEHFTGNWHIEDNGGELRVVLNITGDYPFTTSLDVDGGKYISFDDGQFSPDVIVLPFVG